VTLLAHYAHTMNLNVAGMRQGLDLEFLHQFRVGLLRSRALLRHTRGAFPAAQLRAFIEHLVWLGTQTSYVRDADVHSMVFPSVCG
jgi:CHAD domain-containing protein